MLCSARSGASDETARVHAAHVSVVEPGPVVAAGGTMEPVSLAEVRELDRVGDSPRRDGDCRVKRSLSTMEVSQKPQDQGVGHAVEREEAGGDEAEERPRIGSAIGRRRPSRPGDSARALSRPFAQSSHQARG